MSTINLRNILDSERVVVGDADVSDSEVTDPGVRVGCLRGRNAFVVLAFSAELIALGFEISDIKHPANWRNTAALVCNAMYAFSFILSDQCRTKAYHGQPPPRGRLYGYFFAASELFAFCATGGDVYDAAVNQRSKSRNSSYFSAVCSVVALAAGGISKIIDCWSPTAPAEDNPQIN